MALGKERVGTFSAEISHTRGNRTREVVLTEQLDLTQIYRQEKVCDLLDYVDEKCRNKEGWMDG